MATKLLRPMLNLAVSLTAVVAIWFAFLQVFAVDPLVAKSPTAVLRYLFTGVDAGAHRQRAPAGLGQTLADAGLGLAAGLTTAIAVALSFGPPAGSNRPCFQSRSSSGRSRWLP